MVFWYTKSLTIKKFLMEQNFITIQSDAFRAIMMKLEQIESYVINREKEDIKRRKANSRLLTGEDVIKMLRISKQTLWRMRKRGDIAYIRPGNICLYTQEEIERIVNNQIIRYRRK